MDRTLYKFIIRQTFNIAEELKKWFGFGGAPIMIPKRWIEPARGGAAAIFPFVFENIFMKVLTNVIVNRVGLSIRIVIVAESDNEIRIPTFNEIRYIQKRLPRQPIIADDTKDDAVALGLG